ncbi:MAG: response regulator transcription factor [Chloroflexi bacterium]|nr:response regulator transcription factor [Chloroflexota bacterium]MCI0855043.1 response regulator transcription factor [Chloroflexota bacterium]MCI0889525.1 response regulator transcription factor [Chloroflexota bacterium]
MPIRVLIVDDHAVVRQGLKAFLRVQEDIEFVGEAANGDEAVTQALSVQPDVILMDLIMPGMDGVETMRRLSAAGVDAKVIVLTSFSEDDQVLAAVKAGAAGYLLKDVQPQELGNAIRSVHAGDAQLHPSVASKLMREVAAAGSRHKDADALTARELEVLKALARGMSNKEIAAELGVAEKTVKTHVSSILRKLGVADRTQAALYAVRERLADP